MDKNKLAAKVKEIEMPEDMQRRIIRNCYGEMEKQNMRTEKSHFQKPLMAAVVLMICLCLSGITVLAATGKLEGFFKDIKRWDGAVVGTSYEQATDEVKLSVVTATDKLTVEITMLKPDVAPYAFFELFGIHKYQIIDENGNTVAENEAVEISPVEAGKVSVSIPLENIPGGGYTLIISELIGSAKADQPLVLSGTWECEFIR